jgi:hypothetical protein
MLELICYKTCPAMNTQTMVSKISFLVVLCLFYPLFQCFGQGGDTLNLEELRLVGVGVKPVKGSKIYKDFVLQFRVGGVKKKLEVHSISAQIGTDCIQKGKGCCLCKGRTYSFRLIRVCDKQDFRMLNDHGTFYHESVTFVEDEENCAKVRLDLRDEIASAPYQVSIFDWYFVMIGDRLYYVDEVSPCCKYDRTMEQMDRKCPCI